MTELVAIGATAEGQLVTERRVRGVEVSFQTVAEWAAKFGREYARILR